MASHQEVFSLALTMVLVVLPSLTCGVTLYVRPSNTSCPTHPCHTLSEYVQDPGQYFNHSNLTLKFLPGNHTLVVNVNITSIHQLEILANSSAVVPTRVVCNFNAGFVFKKIIEMRIDGLTFISCATGYAIRKRRFYKMPCGLCLQLLRMTEIIDTTFQNTSLEVADSRVVLRGSNSFSRNCELQSIKFLCDERGVVVKGYSFVSFNGISSFIGNSSTYSGAGVSVGMFSVVKISGNTTFISNSASRCGGAISVFFSSVYISGNTTFIDNSATLGDGGGVCSQGFGNVYISGNTTFINNSGGNGGGIYAKIKSSISISGNTTFISNSGGNGGGIYAYDWSNVTITGNTAFINNSASRNGGGIYSECASKINISGSTSFIGNSAELGGGICALVHLVNLGSKTLGLGGRNHINVYTARYCELGRNNMFSIHDWLQKLEVRSNGITICGNTTFINNSAEDGGGMYIKYDVNINGNTIFFGNSATEGEGGGVYAGSESFIGISGNTTFIDNFASTDGGGVYTSQSSCFEVNGNNTFIGNLAGDGGGFYVGSRSVEVVGNTTFTSNSAIRGGCIFLSQSMTLDGDGSFTNCSASDGGAIYARGIQIHLTISGTNAFIANTAANFGGGIYAHASSFDLTTDNKFIANFAGLRGGGIYTYMTKMNFIGKGLLSCNVAQLDGGGIYADDSNLTFNGSITIRNNTAQLGGGVYSDNNTFNIDGHNVFEKNIAAHNGGGIYTRRSLLTVTGNNTFVANSAGEGGGIYATANSIVNLNGVNTFVFNRAHASGGAIWLDNSNLGLDGLNHFVKCVASYEGGAIFIYTAKLSLFDIDNFDSNSATTGGGIHARWSSVRIKRSSNFTNNVAVFGGGIFTDSSTFEFNGSSTFSSNQANYTGGGIYASRSILNFLGVSSVTANRAARDGGGMYTRDDCVVNLLGLSNYYNNSAGDTGGGISVYRSNFNLAGQSTFNRNQAVEGGGFYAFKSTVNFSVLNTFSTNSASNHGGGFTIMHGTLHLNGSTAFKNNSAASGGGMYISDSTVHSDGSNCFMNNMAKSGGGAINARDSLMQFHGRDMFVANSAENKGAGIHSFFTTLIFQGGSSFVNNSAIYGGGIYSKSSNLTFIHSRLEHYAPCISVHNASLDPENVFHNNTALRGGAQYFDLYSNFSVYQTAQVHFQDNHATEFGGAIYAADVSGPGQFLSQQHTPFRSECFFHMLSKEQSPHFNESPLLFVNNSAGIRGSILYGGLLEKCNITLERYTSAMELFNKSILHVGRRDDTSYSISSDPTQLCFCNTSGLNFREASQSRSIYPGQQVAVSVVAIDQSGSVIPTFIHTIIHSGHNLTVSEIISYETEENCTNRNYSVTTKNIFNQLELYPNNRSGNTIHLIVNITFESCPIGFEQSNFTGECICDHRLWHYTNSCDIDRQTILRNATQTFWIGVSYINGTSEGYIHHSYCPLDYCTSESKHINLHKPDKQCNYNRSGLLCGKCKQNLSLLLGSSQCKECSNNYLALLIPFALAGILLVILLFLLHLTVAAGTLHGLIFYANIVAANHHIFFPQSSNNPASIFIAWLNLDLGIQTCFVNGMDVYAKMWLEFVFPVYIWVIVGLLVYISHRSVTVTKLLGSSPVPVLATLFLLSYAKLLRIMIAVLSLTTLHYPDKDVVVWIYDANVSSAKYIPLVLVALLFLIFLFLPYTLLLLLGQWLQPISHLSILSWVKSPKLKAILDTYHAPYKPNYRFWTGLLLLVRWTLFLVFAFNVSRDNSVNLLVTSSATSGIFVGFALLGSVYKSWYLNALELSFILNLGLLAVATYHVTLSGGSQSAVAYTSVGIAFLTFVGIVINHIYIRIKSKVQYIQRGHQLHHRNNCHGNNDNDNLGNSSHQQKNTPAITRTEVNLHELRSPLDLIAYHQMD